MQINQYDAITGAYINSVLADPDPADESRWLIPAFSTTVPIPDRQRYQWPFFVEGAWVLKPDYRGVALYCTRTGAPQEILNPGIDPAGAGLTTEARPSDEYRWTDGTGWMVDETVVAARKKAAALAEFDTRMANASQRNWGKSDAMITGLLSVGEVAVYRAWAKYQMDCIAIVQSPTFPDSYAWPPEPDEEAVAQQAVSDAQAAADAIFAQVEQQKADETARAAAAAAERAANNGTNASTAVEPAAVQPASRAQ